MSILTNGMEILKLLNTIFETVKAVEATTPVDAQGTGAFKLELVKTLIQVIYENGTHSVPFSELISPIETAVKAAVSFYNNIGLFKTLIGK